MASERHRGAPTITRSAFLEDGSDARFRRFIYSFLITSVRMQRIRERIGGFIGLNGIQYHILTVISELGSTGPCTVGEVARSLHAGKTHVTMETGKLVRKGLVEKRPNPDDGRSVLVSLTAEGKHAMEKLFPYRRQVNDVLFDGFSTEEFHAFEALLDKMVTTTGLALAAADGHIADPNDAEATA